jgi:hypothetical protein
VRHLALLKPLGCSHDAPAPKQVRPNYPRATLAIRRSDYGVSPDGGRARRHHASSARAGISAQMNPSHTGTPNVLAAASPSTTPADGRSQKYRYGTALVAHQAGRAARTFLTTDDRWRLEHLVLLTVRIACPGNTFDDDATHPQLTRGSRTRGGPEKPVVRRLTSNPTTSDISGSRSRRASSRSLPSWCASARDPGRQRRVPRDGIRPTDISRCKGPNTGEPHERGLVCSSVDPTGAHPSHLD